MLVMPCAMAQRHSSAYPSLGLEPQCLPPFLLSSYCVTCMRAQDAPAGVQLIALICRGQCCRSRAGCSSAGTAACTAGRCAAQARGAHEVDHGPHADEEADEGQGLPGPGVGVLVQPQGALQGGTPQRRTLLREVLGVLQVAVVVGGAVVLDVLQQVVAVEAARGSRVSGQASAQAGSGISAVA